MAPQFNLYTLNGLSRSGGIKLPKKTLLSAFLGWVFWCLLFNGSMASEISDARINMGLRLFRATLFADLDIHQKTDNENHLSLLILYKDDPKVAESYRKSLLELGQKGGMSQIQHLDIRVETTDLENFTTTPDVQYAGIFILDRLSPEELSQIVSYAVKQKLIVFSPYESDIENHVTASISVGARVHPIINMRTLRRSQIRLKRFFLKVAEKYESE